LEPGTYTVLVSFAGFAAQQFSGITTVSGQSLELNVTLLPSEIDVEPVVIMTSDVPIVDTKRTVTGTTLATHELESLPSNTRSVLDLIFTLPGVTEEPLSTRDLAEDRNVNHATRRRSRHVFSRRAPAYSNNLTIDGLDNNDDRAARERFQPSLEAVAEVQVITNQFSAEYGVRPVDGESADTKRSKQFHWRGFYFFQDESLNANSFNNNSRGLPRLPLQDHVGGLRLVDHCWRDGFLCFLRTAQRFGQCGDRHAGSGQQRQRFRLAAPTDLGHSRP
jgi:hypothetical protein